MPSKHGTNFDLFITTRSYPMSVDTTLDESILTRAQIENTKPSYKPTDST